ncbi:hypothetical protein C1646_48968 [Rhizophagus diaphanus]|nr:hypothetical protein C1646_48968 [Rhizophagus diaphanus] [Rhizophagus sp. MUCL 43196]
MCKPCSDVCINDPTKLWEEGIVPYKFDNMVSSQFVNKAMEEITMFSPIKFVERTNHVKIVNKGGYWSYAGKQGGEQVITIFNYALSFRFMHEIEVGSKKRF